MSPVGARPDRVIAHLLRDLADDARHLWEAQPDVLTGRQTTARLHDAVHARLSAVSRSLRETRRGIPIHAAACIAPDGIGLVLPGRTRSGKSTTAAILGMELRATVTSDDTIWLDSSGASSIGAPLAVRPESPLRERARSLWHADDSDRLLARASDLGAPPMRTAGPVDQLMFPRFEPDLPVSSRRVPPAEAFALLTTALLRMCSDDELLTLARVAGRCPATQLVYGDLPSSVRLCTEVLDAAPPAMSCDVEVIDPDRLEERGCRPGVSGIRFDGDVALWHRSRNRIAHVSGWDGGPLWHTAAWDQLRSIGLVGDR